MLHCTVEYYTALQSTEGWSRPRNQQKPKQALVHHLEIGAERGSERAREPTKPPPQTTHTHTHRKQQQTNEGKTS